MDVPLADLDALARRFAGERHDAYSERALARGYEEYLGRRRTPLAPFVLAAREREYPSFYALLAEGEPELPTVELLLDPAPGPGPSWEYLRPFERIVIRADGSGELCPPDGAEPQRAIVRFLLREHYLPRSRSEEERGAAGGARVTLAAFLSTFEQGVTGCRRASLLPFSVALLLYLPDERVRVELDLVRSVVLADPRVGRLPRSRRVPRTARFGWGVDRLVGRGDLPLLSSRCLEVVADSSGLTGVELAHVFGAVRELVDSALQGLVARQWVTFDARAGVYRPRVDAFLPPPGAPAPSLDRRELVSDPALRTSVQELLAAADARATCPLCGRPLPPGPRGILCASCAAEVSGA